MISVVLVGKEDGLAELLKLKRKLNADDNIDLMAMSTFSPVGLRSSNGMRECVCVCVCVCVCGRNELNLCTTLAYPHVYQFIP